MDGNNQNHILDLVPLQSQSKASTEVEEFAQHLKSIQGKIRNQLKQSNENYKSKVDLHMGKSDFNEGGLVIIYLKKEIFPTGTYNKLKQRKIHPCQILKKFEPITYKV